MNEKQEIVEKIAELIKTYFDVQGYSGIGDSIPREISCALLKGYITCKKCAGTGIRLGTSNDCTVCCATGKIDFKIET